MNTLTQENTTLSRNNPVLPEVPQQLEARPKSNFLAILLSVLLLISLVIAGFFAYQTQKIVKEIAKLQNSSTPIATIEPSPDPTVDWQTYSNTKLGVEFKYPVEWSTPKEQLQTISFYNKLTITKGPFYDLVLKRDLSFDEYVIRSYGDETPRYDFNLNKLVGKRGIEKSVSNYNDIVILAKDNKTTDIVSLSYLYNPLSENSNIFDQILSTFKFINEPSKCLTIEDPCNPQACNYDQSKCNN